MTQPHFGFIGIGRMGSLMAPRLLDAGYTLSVYDVVSSATDGLTSRGAHKATSPADVASQAEIVFVSLPTPAIVEKVVFGKDGISEGTKVKIYIDLSTTGPRAAASISNRLQKIGINAVDSPVSGGLAGARNGTLAVMVSCMNTVFEQVSPILKTFGKVFFVGEQPGNSQMIKLINNLLAAASQAISSEAMVLGVKAGLNASTMIEIINASSGRNTATLDKFPKAVLPRTFDFGFATGLSLKDVRLCLEEAENLGVPMSVGSAVRQLLAITSAMYGPESDFTSMIRPLEQWANVEVRG